MEDSPPPFIVIRSPSEATVPRSDVYDLALQLVAAVHELVDSATGRYPLKRQLDQAATSVVMQIARLKSGSKGPDWQRFRHVHDTAVEASAVLDIMIAQGATGEPIQRAKAIAAQLLRQLAPLGLLGY